MCLLKSKNVKLSSDWRLTTNKNVQRIRVLFNAKDATINFDLRRIKNIFIVNNAWYENLYISKR